MGKHSKRRTRNLGRAALVIGAAPLAVLIASGTASASQVGMVNPLGVPIGSVDTNLDTHTAHTPDGQSSTVAGAIQRTTSFANTTDTTANSASDSIAGDRTMAVDPNAGSADLGQSMRGSAGTTATHTITSALPGGGNATVSDGSGVSGEAGTATTGHVDRTGQVVGGGSNDQSLGGLHNLSAAGNYGPWSGMAQSNQATNGSMHETHSFGLSPRSGVLSAEDIGGDREMHTSQAGSFGMGPMTLSASDSKALGGSAGVTHTGTLTPDARNTTTNTVHGALSAEHASSRAMTVGNVFGVSETESTSGTLAGSVTAAEHGGIPDMPKHTLEYSFAHSQNVHVQVGPKSYDRGVDVTFPPLKVTPHSS